MPKMIYHVPYPLNFQATAGSGIRPVKMFQSFEAIGYEVLLVSGYGKERRAAIKEAKRRIRAGEKFDFLYSESATIATPLTDPKHLPPHFLLDFNFFRFCEANSIHTGVFYRDIYWRFPIYRQLTGTLVSFAMRRIFRWDLWNYRTTLTKLFLPSLEMGSYIPIVQPKKFSALPPGAPSSPAPLHREQLSLLYVGGLGSHYRLHRLLEAVIQLPQVKLTICTPKNVWEACKDEYEHLLGNNVELIHLHGAELEPYFKQANVGCIAVESDEYWRFAVPIKLFDYLGHGLPVFATADTWAGKFVSQNQSGWTVEYDVEAIKTKLESLSALSWVENMETHIKTVSAENTWEARAREVARQLS